MIEIIEQRASYAPPPWIFAKLMSFDWEKKVHYDYYNFQLLFKTKTGIKNIPIASFVFQRERSFSC